VVGAAAHGVDGVVGLAEVGGNADGAKPGGGSASAGGQEDAQQQHGQAQGGAAIEAGGKAVENPRQPRGQVRE
jgi:hypothetical protein